jgi:predicted oxidoreductase
MKGRGVGLVTPIYRQCLTFPNIRFVWNTKALSLLVNAGRVTGVKAVHLRTGQSNEFFGGVVVLATGGFESNLEWVRNYWPHYFPPLSSDTRILSGSGINAVGSGFDLAMRGGAALTNLDHQLFYATGLLDPRDPAGKRGLHAFNRAAIWVNVEGKRFVWDGAPDPKAQMRALLQQSQPFYWAFFDSSSRSQFFVSGSDWNDTNLVEELIFANPRMGQWVKRADTLDALASATGLPIDNLRQTIARWNEMVEAGEDKDFHRFTRSSLERPIKIEAPPFFAVQLVPLSPKSLGGVAVDFHGRVLDKQNSAIPGLYAVGELTGVGRINGKAALEGTMLGPSILMGRLAAQDIARGFSPGPRPPSRILEKSDIQTNSPTQPATLSSWRQILRQLIAQPRPGYWHFEKVHAVVLDHQYDCIKCHHEASPLAVTAEQLDRWALSQSCRICHGGAEK